MTRERGRDEYQHGHGHSDIDQLRKSISQDIKDLVKAIEALSTPAPSVGGKFSMHVTEVSFKEESMPVVDVTPQLDLASSAVRAKISVVNPRKPDGSRLTSVTWRVEAESEPGALVLEAAPDDTVKDENGAEVLDPVDNLPLLVFSTYANTPLEPVAPARASGKVIASGSQMADCSKVVSYGDAPVGHFTMVGTEAPEV